MPRRVRGLGGMEACVISAGSEIRLSTLPRLSDSVNSCTRSRKRRATGQVGFQGNADHAAAAAYLAPGQRVLRVAGQAGVDDVLDLRLDAQPGGQLILTGSTPDGRAYPEGADKTCRNYTSGAEDGSVQPGHFDRTGVGNASWNSAHGSRGCSQPRLVSTGGAGLLYCFAAN